MPCAQNDILQENMLNGIIEYEYIIIEYEYNTWDHIHNDLFMQNES